MMKIGDHVAWKYANGIAEGKIESVHSEPTQIISKGKRIKRNGSRENPALIIVHKSGNDVLKLLSEVQRTK